MNNTIQAQKGTADEVLRALFPVDPYAIVAGGAPRDWYMGNTASDIDVFFYTRPKARLTTVRKQLEHVGFVIDSVKTGEGIPCVYKMNPLLLAVFNCCINGTKVQLMLMTESTFTSTVEKFPLSISQAWYKDGKSRYSKAFQLSVKHKVIFKTGELYSDENSYIQKITKKFPEFKYFNNKAQALEFILRKQ